MVKRLNAEEVNQLKEGLTKLVSVVKEGSSISLRSVVDYCKLHHTTGEESYRLKAVDGMRKYEVMMRFGDNFVAKPVEIVYTEVLKEMGFENPTLFLKMVKIGQPEMAPIINGLEKVVDLLRERNDFKPLHDWRNYCLTCPVPNSTCDTNVNNLEERYQARLTALESAWDGLLVAVKPYIGKLTKEVVSGNISMSGLGLKRSSNIEELRTGRRNPLGASRNSI